jgi:type I restriction enzyme M protein
MINTSKLISVLENLEFTRITNNPYKYTINIDGYQIECEFDDNNGNVLTSSINYGNSIKVGHSGVCNFSKDEYIVQLECVVRLLKKGYQASQLELEKTFTLGHNDKGRLDILVKKDGISWAMIECKTFGSEYDDEIKRVEKNGSQIFSYYAQDRTPSIIGVYASNLIDLCFDFYQISTQKLDKIGSNKDIFNSWDRKYVSKGILADGVQPYECESFNIRKKDLKDLDKKNGTKLYNRFMEILRRYAISDKSNAFNIFFNLFVCKIFDEESKAEDDVLDFQWKLSDNSSVFISRLSSLYYSAIKQYLGMECDSSYYTTLGNGMLFPVKEFSFIEILNAKDFDKNANILVEVVKILQEYKIKYFTRQQFLGDFFENLLNKGFKQESGQFFTPYPLTRFILRSIPIDLIISKKIVKREPYVLPYTIDFACGSGHFLTESILEIEKNFSSIAIDSLNGPQRRNYENLKNNYYWAKEYIYGIEKDSRLAKTTKVAMFLNGDGDADIISADGLGDFHSNSVYRNKLKILMEKPSNNNFDIVVSNPPFSVEGFFNTIENIDLFSLKDYLTPKSCEIECFFLERALQLLNEDGYAGLIFPMSLLNNKNPIYTQTRKLLLLNFDIFAIVEMREKAFSATPTTTVILFLKKKSSEVHRMQLNKYLKEKGIPDNSTIADSSNSDLLKYSYLTKEPGEDYTKFLVTNYTHKIVVSFSGEKKNQEFFQGYRFSKGRGKEELVEVNYGCLTSKDSDYGDNDLASIIHSLCHGEEIELGGKSISKYCTYIDAHEMFEDVKTNLISPPSKFLTTKTIKVESISPIGDLVDLYEHDSINLAKLIKEGKVKILPGLTYEKQDEVPYRTSNIVLTASNINLQTGLLDTSTKLIYLREDFPVNNDITIIKNDILISMSSGSLKHLGKVALISSDEKMMAGGFLNIIRCNDEKLAVAIYYRLMSKRFRQFVFSKKGQNINNLSANEIQKIDLQLPTDLSAFIEAVRLQNSEHKIIKYDISPDADAPKSSKKPVLYVAEKTKE